MLYRRGTGLQSWRLKRGTELVELLPRCDFSSNDYWTVKYFAVAGEGIVYLPTFFADIECERGHLVPLMPEWQSEEKWIYIRIPQHNNASRKTRAFVDFCKDYFSRATASAARVIMSRPCSTLLPTKRGPIHEDFGNRQRRAPDALGRPRSAAHQLRRDPIIDLEPMFSGDAEAKAELAAKLRKVCAEVGFLYVRNHHVPQAVIDATFSAAHGYFAQDDAAKMRNHVSLSRNNRGYAALLEENTDPTARGDLMNPTISPSKSRPTMRTFSPARCSTARTSGPKGRRPSARRSRPITPRC